MNENAGENLNCGPPLSAMKRCPSSSNSTTMTLPLGPGPAFSLMVTCKTQKEIDYYWDKLLAGGAPSACGWLTDRFGFSWQIVPEIVGKVMGSKDAVRTNRFMNALMPMVKLDLATLEAAAKGPKPSAKKAPKRKAA